LASPVFFFCIILLNHSLVFVILLTLRSYTQSRNKLYSSCALQSSSLLISRTTNESAWPGSSPSLILHRDPKQRSVWTSAAQYQQLPGNAKLTRNEPLNIKAYSVLLREILHMGKKLILPYCTRLW